MTAEDEISLAERRAVLRNDRRVGTYHSHAAAEAGAARGRYRVISKTQVTGTGPVPQYPRQPADGPWASEPVGLEPPFPGDISAPAVVGEAYEVEKSLQRLGEADPPSVQPDGGEVSSSDIGRVSGAVEPASPPMRLARVSDGASSAALSGGGRVLRDDGAAPPFSSKRMRK